MFAINFEMIISIVCDYLFYCEQLFAVRVKNGYKKGDIYWGLCPGYHTIPELNDVIQYHDKALEKVYAVIEVTGIQYDTLITAAKYYNRYGNKTGWNAVMNERECRRLIETLTAAPETFDGVYSNPYTTRAIERLERARYEKYAPVWGNW